jgi:hypothetical protein
MARQVKQATPFARDGKRLRVLRLALAKHLERPEFEATKGGIETFAREIGYPSNRYGQFENGVRLITLEAARLLKAKFPVDLDYIYDGSKDSLPYKLAEKIEQLQARS